MAFSGTKYFGIFGLGTKLPYGQTWIARFVFGGTRGFAKFW